MFSECTVSVRALFTYAVLMIACVQGKDLETIDLKRTGRSATAGLLIHGPLCHFWIQLMQTYLVSHPTLMTHTRCCAVLLLRSSTECSTN